MSKKITPEQHEKATGWLATQLEKIGLGNKWAKIIAAAVIASLAAALGISVTGCGMLPKITIEHPQYGNIVIHQNYQK